MYYTEKQNINLDKLYDILTAIIKGLLFLEGFTVPLLFLPFTSEYFDTAKIFFLCIVDVICIILLIVRYATKNEFKFYKSYLGVIFIIAFLIICLSTIFSLNQSISALGFFGRAYQTPVYFLSLFATVYLIINIFESEIEVEIFGRLLVASCALAGIFYLLERFSLAGWLNMHFPILASSNFSPVISVDQLPYVCLLAIFIVYSLLLNKLMNGFTTNMSKYIHTVVYAIILLIFFACIGLASNTLIPFIILGLGIAYAGYLSVKMLGNKPSVFGPVFGTAGILFIIAIGLRLFVFKNDASIHVLSFADAWSIYTGTANSFKNVLFGTGPDTFYFDFLKYIPAPYYASPLYSVEFSKSATSFLQIITTMGVFGVIAYGAVMISALIYSLRILKSTLDVYAKTIVIGISVAILVYILIFFTDTSSATLDFMFFAFLGILCFEGNTAALANKAFVHIKVVVEDFWDKKSMAVKNAAYGISIFVLLIAGFLVVYNYQTEVLYNQSITTTNAETAYNDAVTVSERETFVDYYNAQLASTSVAIAVNANKNLASIANAKTKASIQQLINSLASQGLTKSELVFVQNPSNPLDINQRISIILDVYKNLQQSASFLSEAQSEADLLTTLYPNNLTYDDQLGEVYYEQANYTKADSVFSAAYSINPADTTVAVNYMLTLMHESKYTQALDVGQQELPQVQKKSSLYQVLVQEIAEAQAGAHQ